MADTPAERDYQGAGFGGSLPFGGRQALILVDPARAYSDPECPLYAGCEAAIEGMARTLEVCRRAGVPVIVTRMRVDPEGGPQGGLFLRKVPAARWFADERFGGFIDGLAPGPGEVLLEKWYPSAFAGTHLASWLTAASVDTVIIAGLTTSGCIRATALDALQHGFAPFVVADAVGDRRPEVHDANLFDISAKIADVVTVASLSALLGGA